MHSAAVPVRTSGGSQVLERVGAEPAVVVSTPGAEPVADGGYSAAVLLDGWAMLGLASLRAAEEALRRWMNAAALVRPAGEGGSVIIVADGGQSAVQALIRWDPATFADRELAERAELRFPPTARMASIAGPADAVADLLAAARLPDGAELLGPLPAADGPPAAPAGRRTWPGRPARLSGQPGFKPSGTSCGCRGQRAGTWPRRCTLARPSGRRPRSPASSGCSSTLPL